jgi:hypothetical protein
VKIRSHYDNLKVSRDAPAEVIRAAYKTLTQKYHPDRNPDDESALRVMQLLNEAYEVLSDPKRREQHDRWIAAEEDRAARSSAVKDAFTQPKPTPAPEPEAPREPTQSRKPSMVAGLLLFPFGVILHVLANLRFYLSVGFFCFIGVYVYLEYQRFKTKDEPVVVSPARTVYKREPVVVSPELAEKIRQDVEREARASAAAKAKYAAEAGQAKATPVAAQASATAKAPAKAAANKSASSSPMCSPAISKGPNGAPWPARAAYVGPISRTAGHSTITIDNSSGTASIWVKLARPGEKKTAGIREAYIPKGSNFTMNKIEAGTYVVKYKDVATGCNAVSDPFDVKQIEDYNSIRYSQITLTIYQVLNGNMEFDRLPEASF